MPLKRLIQRNPSRPGMNPEPFPAKRKGRRPGARRPEGRPAGTRQPTRPPAGIPETRLKKSDFDFKTRQEPSKPPAASPAIDGPPEKPKATHHTNSDPTFQKTTRRRPSPE